MSDKIYTAQEMRTRAKRIEFVYGLKSTAAMLRQAADALTNGCVLIVQKRENERKNRRKKMANNERNALAELAENLEHDNFFGCDHFKRELWVGKAQRIIAELAKVETPYDLVGLVGKCHAIAAEQF